MAKQHKNFAMGMAEQMTIFDIIEPVNNKPEPGSLNMAVQVKETLVAILKAAPCKRWEVAGRMGEYLGIEITESQLNSWSAESKEGYRFPLEYLPALCYATGDFNLAKVIITACGCHLVKSEEAILLELARIDVAKREMDSDENRLREQLEKMRNIKKGS